MQNDIRLVQTSFARVAPVADAASKLFCQRLFATAPETRALFGDDLVAHRAQLVEALGLLVNGLRDIPAMTPAIATLARRLRNAGVADAHYDKVGAALVWTLQQALGPAFTPEVKAAWVRVATAIADTMRATTNRADAA